MLQFVSSDGPAPMVRRPRAPVLTAQSFEDTALEVSGEWHPVIGAHQLKMKFEHSVVGISAHSTNQELVRIAERRRRPPTKHSLVTCGAAQLHGLRIFHAERETEEFHCAVEDLLQPGA